MKYEKKILLYLILMLFSGMAGGAGPVNGVTELTLISDFSRKDTGEWTLKDGGNLKLKLDFGAKLTKDKKITGLKAEIMRIDPTKSSSQGSWLILRKNIKGKSLWLQADGVKIGLGAEKACRWWIECRLVAGKEVYMQVIRPVELLRDGLIEERLLPFAKFKNKNKRPLDISKINSINLTIVGLDNTLLLAGISLYRHDKNRFALNFISSEPVTNIFQREETVDITLTKSTNCPWNFNRILVNISDFFGHKIFDKILSPVTVNGNSFKLKFQSLKPGFYEVSAWPLDNKGKKLLQYSSIKSSGSQPYGKATFAIVPRTIAENHARMKKMGVNAFFGLHGSFANLHSLIGATWQMSGTGRWAWKEPNKNASIRKDDSPAAWAAQRLALPPSPQWKVHFANLAINHLKSIPKWAQSSKSDQAPGYKTEAFDNYFKDVVTVEKHRWPHMPYRIYDPAWEINLNSPEMSVHKPVYTADDIVKLYHRLRSIVRKIDHEGLLAGPCTSTINAFPWTEQLFKKGLLKEIDVFNFHGYHSPPPEKDNVPGKIRQLHALIKKYNSGKKLDLYCTELGYRSLYGTVDRHKEQARWHVRVATILKGEGVKAYSPFYPYDFRDDLQTWGICYTLDPKRRFPPAAVMPKSAVPALAVCIDQLEGTEVIGPFKYFGSDVYAYLFSKSGSPLLAIWSVENSHLVRLPLQKPGQPGLRSVNIMGHVRKLVQTENYVELNISPDIQYIYGLPVGIYGKKIEDRNIKGEVYLGGETQLKIGELKKRKIINRGYGIDVSRIDGDIVKISAPNNITAGIYPLLSDDFGDGIASWISVREPVEICEVKPVADRNGLGCGISVFNHGGSLLNIDLEVKSAKTGRYCRKIKIKPRSSSYCLVPLLQVKPGQSYRLDITVKPDGMSKVKVSKRLTFLAAHSCSEEGWSNTLLPNEIEWKGRGSSGVEDNAKATFNWDDKNLYLNIAVHDKQHVQSHKNGGIWNDDSIQIAFDTDPNRESVYNPLGGIFNKKITEICLAGRGKGGQIVWRHVSHDVNELPLGDISKNVKLDFSRKKNQDLSIYKITVPWKELGIYKVSKGKLIGISILVNDRDPRGKRQGLELFGGILHDKSHEKFGCFILE